ncbi:hypothetical protein DXV76_08885 [Rhodobacteraceae bacterium CCMM004]|nr:hypothetical protein DXV76_08885 [Rhodobacteraceae bacterium CCMM004]
MTDRDAPLLRIHLTGPLRIAGADGAPLVGLSRRGQAALAVLADAPGHRVERAWLADLLWSDRATDQARASLRQELSVLRRALPQGVLASDRQQVWLDPARVALAPPDGRPVLEGFDLPSEGFEDWLRTARQRPAPPAIAAVATDERHGRPVLAVLPFDEIGAARDDMFADGIVEEITGALSRIRDVDVIARQSAFALRDAALDRDAVAARLGADYLIEGSVRRSGERVRIAARLVAGSGGRTLWSGRFDDRIDDLFDLQDRIAAHVAGQLSPGLRAVEIDRAARLEPADRSAYELTLTALPRFWAHRREDNAIAIRRLTAALERDPDYVPAVAYKAWALAQQPSYMWSEDPAADHEAARALGRWAAVRAGDHAPTLVALSAVEALSGDDPDLSYSFAERALAIDPSNAWGWMRLGWAEHYRRSDETPLAAFDRAMDLSPLDPFLFNCHLGRSATFREMRRYDEALAELDAGFRANPGITWAHRMYVGTYGMAGRMAEAAEAAHRFVAHYPYANAAYIAACWPRALPDRQHYYADAFRDAFAAAGLSYD